MQPPQFIRRSFLCRIPAAVAGSVLTAILFGSVNAEPTEQQPRPHEYTMGVFPFLAKPVLEGVFAPIAAELSAALKREIRLQTASSFEKFSEQLAAGTFDIAHVHPFEQVIAGEKAGYIPVATRTELLQGVVSVREKSPVRTPRDLKGKTVGFPPRVASVSYLARYALSRAGVDPERDIVIKHFSTHTSCLQQLLIGNIDACASGKASLRLFEDQSGKKFRVVLSSPEVTQTLFVVHRRVPEPERAKIRDTIIRSELATIAPQFRSIFLKGPRGDGTEGYFRPLAEGELTVIRRYLRELREE